MSNNVDTSKARQSAIDLLKRFEVRRIPVPLPRLARGLGLIVEYTPLDDELSGMALIKDDKQLIWINALHHPNRQRFTLAHEIGHHLLHKNAINESVHVDKGILRRDTVSASGTEKLEIEANAFASELLMPTSEITKALDDEFDLDDHDKLESLAKKFKVSVAAMQIRLIRH